MTDPTPDAPDFSALDAAYVPPAHLRTPFREFLLKSNRGLYWLRAPAGVGKTLFVRGMTARRPGKDPAVLEGIDSAIASDVCAVGIHLGAGPAVGPRQLVARLATAVAAASGTAAPPPAPDFDDAAPEQSRAAFLAHLGQWRDTVVAHGARRLLVAIDGLDAATRPGAGPADQAGAPLAFLPAAGEVPDGVVLVLTSRPAEDWPDGLFSATAGRLGAGVAMRDVALTDAGYGEMLRSYFREKLRPMLRQRAVAHLTQLLETKAPFEKGGRDARLTNDPVLRDGLKDDWKKLTNKFPRYTGLPLPVTPIVGILDQFDTLWADVIDRSELRFSHLSLLVAGLLDGSLDIAQVAEAPSGEGLPAFLAARRG